MLRKPIEHGGAPSGIILAAEKTPGHRVISAE